MIYLKNVYKNKTLKIRVVKDESGVIILKQNYDCLYLNNEVEEKLIKNAVKDWLEFNEKIILDAENPVWKNILDGEEVSLKKQKGA